MPGGSSPSPAWRSCWPCWASTCWATGCATRSTRRCGWTRRKGAVTMAEQTQAGWRVVLLTDFGGLVVNGLGGLLAGYGHKLVGIVTSPGPRGRGLGRHLDVVAAAPRGVDVLVSNHPRRWAAMLAPLRPDLLISAAFPWVIPDELIALPRVAAVNMHGGLLPQGRGPNAFGWAFRNGDAKVGFTIHRLDSGLDTGPILSQITVPLTDDDDMETL